MAKKVILEDNEGEEIIPFTSLATSNEAGRVRPDNSTLTVNVNGILSVNGVTGTELSYLGGVTSSIQTQLNNKLNNTSLQVVQELPTNPDSNTFYFIVEE